MEFDVLESIKKEAESILEENIMLAEMQFSKLDKKFRPLGIVPEEGRRYAALMSRIAREIGALRLKRQFDAPDPESELHKEFASQEYLLADRAKVVRSLIHLVMRTTVGFEVPSIGIYRGWTIGECEQESPLIELLNKMKGGSHGELG